MKNLIAEKINSYSLKSLQLKKKLVFIDISKSLVENKSF